MIQKRWWLAFPVIGLLIGAFVAAGGLPGDSTLPISQVSVVASYPHDPGAFSQGFAVEGDTLYEGTGKYGASSLRRVDLQTGKVEKNVPLHQDYFGEGITVLGDRIYQLTWKRKICVVYNKADLAPIGSLPYGWNARYMEGWGITNDGTNLFVSDGTNSIYVVSPKDLSQIRRLRVKDGRRNLERLNELEYVNGELLANIWYSDMIARIDPDTGDLKGWIDCSNVYPIRQRPDREHVLNGIAYDAATQRLFITGKNWPKVFEIKIQTAR